MAAELTGDVKQKSFKEAFAVFDRDQTGEIDIGDFPTAVRSLGYNPTNSQVEDVLKAANKSEKEKDPEWQYNEFGHPLTPIKFHKCNIKIKGFEC